MLKEEPQKIAIKQFFAFVIDIILISLVLVIYPSIVSLIIFSILWFFYIPFCEYIFGQTLGMKIVGTKIFAATSPLYPVRFISIFRRHIARVSIVWGIIGWLSLFTGQFFKDYVIVYEETCSHDEQIDEELLGFFQGLKYSMRVVYKIMGWSL